MKKESGKIISAIVLTVTALVFGLFSSNVNPSNATFSASPTPSCGTETYYFSQDGANSRVSVNFDSNFQIDVTGLNGWSVNNLWLDENGGGTTYLSYGSGNKSNFNPSNMGNIGTIKVEVYKACASATATATSQPTNAPTASPTEEGKVYWCHYEPNGNHQTLHLPMAALMNAGHVGANGNPLHAGDHAGECVDPTATSQPTYSPTSTPTEVPTPTDDPCDDEEKCVEPTSTPEATATPNDGDVCANLDGIQLTVPDEYHHDNAGVNCLKFELGGPSNSNGGGSQVLGASTTNGQVLGASTMAGTGAVEDSFFYSIFSIGSLLTSFGIMKNGKKKA